MFVSVWPVDYRFLSLVFVGFCDGLHFASADVLVVCRLLLRVFWCFWWCWLDFEFYARLRCFGDLWRVAEFWLG